MSNATDIANIIIKQLGGNRFISMTGAKMFTATATGTHFRIPGKRFAKNGINSIVIDLRANDTYSLCFSRRHGMNLTCVETVCGIYADQLQQTFTEVTGLQCHL